MADLTIAEAAQQMLDVLERAAKVAAPPLVDTFAVPALLERIAAPEGGDVSRSTLKALGIETDVGVYRFPDHDAAQAAWEELKSRFAAAKKPVELVAGTGDAFAGPTVALKTGCVDRTLIGEDNNGVYATNNRSSITSDTDVLADASRLSGFRFRYCYGPDLRQPPFSEEDGVVNVFTTGRPPGYFRFKTPIRVLFGKQVWTDGESRTVNSPTYGRGRLIESGGVPIFQVLGRNYYQLALVLASTNNNMLDRTEMWRAILGLMLRDLVQRTEGPKEAAPVQAIDEAYEECVVRMASGRACDAREEIARLDSEIDELQKQLIEKTRQRAKGVTSLKELEREAVEMVRALSDDLARLRSLPGIVRTYFSDDEGLHAVTEPIVMERDGRRYDLGPFCIQVGPEGGIAVWSEAPRHPQGHHHPHVEKTALACFGNITLSLTKLAANYRFGEAVELILRWLRTYNPDLTLIPLEEFPSTPIEAAPTAEKGTNDGRDPELLAAVQAAPA